MPETISDLGKDKTVALFDIIVDELKRHGLYTDDVLPEYVILLIANRHPKEKIIADLEGLVSSDIANGLINWVFQEMDKIKNVAVVQAGALTLSSLESPGPAVQSVVATSQSQPSQPPSDRPKTGIAQNRLFSSALRNAASSQTASASRRMEVDGGDYAGSPRRMPGPTRGDREMRRARSRSPIHEEQRRMGGRGSRTHAHMDGETRSARDDHDSDRVVRRIVGGTVQVNFQDARELLSSGRRRRAGRSGSISEDRHSRGFPRRFADDNASMQMDQMPEHQATGSKTAPPVKCQYWPKCTAGDACKFFHPSEPCKYFPSCQFGDGCLFIHPQVPCKFQAMCQNPFCNYTHHMGPSKGGIVLPPSTVTCKFYPNCMNPSCPFVHPIDVPCKFGENCQRPGCHFTHPANHVLAPKTKCHFGKNCAKADCPYQHPHKDALSPMADVAASEPPSAAVAPTSAMITDVPQIEPAVNSVA